MKNRYIITITTVNGTKHYNVRHIIKYILAALLFLIVTVITAGYFYIDFLKSKIVKIENEKVTLIKDKKRLQKDIVKLNSNIAQLNLELVDKKHNLEELGSKINDLEEQLGLVNEEFFGKVDLKALSMRDKTKILQLIPSGRPVKDFRITAGFGWRRHPILKKREFHPGIDLAAKGKVPIYATADGVVTDAAYNRYGYGNIIKVAHIDGFSTIYAHLKKRLVKKGDFVHKGDIIGYMGSTGLTTGKHLHYEVRFNKKPLNPLQFIRWNVEKFDTIFEKERRVPWESLAKAVKVMLSQKRQHSSPKVQK
ncbi:peptidase, M23/M37 family [Nitratiruptor sp. YY08-26]|uniref:peptidoglycan DD-metalloendopeptidase family protein n=1 Tax=unclassified Nitratiruptor TaxID=2624044 RepID=UPI001916570D|nr:MULTISPECIES: peptidoglycan DD-metalloendopeptidase family protein [unclassified Nitratiruptor]BCD61352.1 peptidase, M23/M37 family [Nitratiruptor sp. YY08-13]BCD65285.1 peptidase, M23/M37 family [Nitratiruptor sp. YY08-26]